MVTGSYHLIRNISVDCVLAPRNNIFLSYKPITEQLIHAISFISITARKGFVVPLDCSHQHSLRPAVQYRVAQRRFAIVHRRQIARRYRGDWRRRNVTLSPVILLQRRQVDLLCFRRGARLVLGGIFIQ